MRSWHQAMVNVFLPCLCASLILIPFSYFLSPLQYLHNRSRTTMRALHTKRALADTDDKKNNDDDHVSNRTPSSRLSLGSENSVFRRLSFLGSRHASSHHSNAFANYLANRHTTIEDVVCSCKDPFLDHCDIHNPREQDFANSAAASAPSAAVAASPSGSIQRRSSDTLAALPEPLRTTSPLMMQARDSSTSASASMRSNQAQSSSSRRPTVSYP